MAPEVLFRVILHPQKDPEIFLSAMEPTLADARSPMAPEDLCREILLQQKDPEIFRSAMATTQVDARSPTVPEVLFSKDFSQIDQSATELTLEDAKSLMAPTDLFRSSPSATEPMANQEETAESPPSVRNFPSATVPMEDPVLTAELHLLLSPRLLVMVPTDPTAFLEHKWPLEPTLSSSTTSPPALIDSRRTANPLVQKP